MFHKRPIDHGFHRALTFLTLGFWALAWLAVTLHRLMRAPWRCGYCRHRFRLVGTDYLSPADAAAPAAGETLRGERARAG